MAIDIKQQFEVDAPIDQVWLFVMDPAKVASCMPGAKLEEVVDDTHFVGSIKVKIGAITTAYKGKVELTEVDAAGYRVVMLAEGTETGGGTAKGGMVSQLSSLESGGTRIVAEANVELTGRIMQVGRGMIQGVSDLLFKQFVKKARKALEVPGGAAGVPDRAGAGSSIESGGVPASAASTAVAEPDDDDSLSIVPILFRALWTAIVNFFRRLFGRA